MSRKNIYIIIIVVCMAGTVGVLYYGFHSPTPPAPPVVQSPTVVQPDSGVSVNRPLGSTSALPTAPTVFPLDTHFDWSVLDSPVYNSLVPVPDLILDPSQVGRNNPFSSR